METELVVKGKALAIAASPERIYISSDNNIKTYSREDFEQERIARISAKQIVYDHSSEYVGILGNSKASIYSSDLRKEVYSFDSGSAACIAADNGTFVLASKRRLRWAKKQANGQWIPDSLSLPGVSALALFKNVLYAAASPNVLAIDLTARVVRDTNIKLPTGWGSHTPQICFTDALVVVSGQRGWYNQQEFKLESTPLAIASLGDSLFWICAYKTKVDMYYGTVIVHTVNLGASVLCNDGFLASPQGGGVYEIKPHITVGFVQEIAKEHPDFALSLSQTLDDPEINELRTQRARHYLDINQWDKAIPLFQNAKISSIQVIEELGPYLDGIQDPSTESSAASVISHASTPDRLIIPQLEAYIPYLAAQKRRVNIERANNELTQDQSAKQLRHIDNALFQCYYLNKSSLIGALVRNPNYCDAENVIKSLKKIGRWRDLVGFLQTRGMHDEALELLAEKGTPLDSAVYLDKVKDWELVKKFAPQILEKEPGLAEHLFADSDYDPHQVYDFLSSNGNEFAVKYLQKHVQESEDPQLHQDLAVYYLDHNMNDELDDFLKQSTAYRPEELLPKIPQELYHARAILYSKMGRHDKVIKLFVDSGDISEALSYCEDTLANNSNSGEKALGYLYNEIKDKFPHELIPFLNSQGHHLNPAKVLNELPSDVKIHSLAPYFANQSRHLQSRTNSASVNKALEQVYLSESTYDLANLRDESVKLTKATPCAFCKRRLGPSVVAVWKQNILHYGCLDSFRMCNS